MRSAGDERSTMKRLLERGLLLLLVGGAIGFFLWRELSDAAFDYGPPASDAGVPLPVLEPAPPRFTPPPIQEE